LIVEAKRTIAVILVSRRYGDVILNPDPVTLHDSDAAFIVHQEQTGTVSYASNRTSLAGTGRWVAHIGLAVDLLQSIQFFRPAIATLLSLIIERSV
jgi:hypothetical protein